MSLTGFFIFFATHLFFPVIIFVQLPYPRLWWQRTHHWELCFSPQVSHLTYPTLPGSDNLFKNLFFKKKWCGYFGSIPSSPFFDLPLAFLFFFLLLFFSLPKYSICSFSAFLVALLLTRASEISWLPTLLTSSMFALHSNLPPPSLPHPLLFATCFSFSLLYLPLLPFFPFQKAIWGTCLWLRMPIPTTTGVPNE